MAKNNNTNEPEELGYWQSYSDMMAALLLVFVLIIATTISMAKKTYEEKQSELERQNAEIINYTEQLEEQKKELLEQQKIMEDQRKQLETKEVEFTEQQKIMEDQRKQLEAKEIEFTEQQQIMEDQQRQLDQIIGVRGNIVALLREEFGNSMMNIHVDAETGAISFDSSVLFDFGKSELKDSGKEFLDQFFPKYFGIIMSDEIKEYISEVIIEGHTDDVGDYLKNLQLSQDRAYAVAEYCLNDDSEIFHKDKLESARELVTANGRSYFELIYDENGEIDRDASRRVEVKFRLTEEEMIQEMSDILENDE